MFARRIPDTLKAFKVGAGFITVLALAAFLLLLSAINALAAIDGITGPNFTLVAREGMINTADGAVHYMWGYANGAAAPVVMQYPGPTLFVNQGAPVTVTLQNQLAVPVSIVFPGQSGVTAIGGAAGLMAREAPPGGSVTYAFTAAEPGTYLYHSGTNAELQVEMGLLGVLIVRPAGFDASDPANRRAYAHADSRYDHEYLFLHTEMDPVIHQQVEFGLNGQVDFSKYFAVLWFYNGRTAPDTLSPAGAAWLPSQPYNCLPRTHPGEKILARVIGGGRDLHPFHTHGNNARIIARDGRLQSSNPGATGADLAESDFTFTVSPGETMDLTFEWTGAKMGWDAYGHPHDLDYPPLGNFPGTEDVDHNGNGVMDSVPLAPNEYAPDHGKPFRVDLPQIQDVLIGAFYGGSPYLGALGTLPPGEGGFNPYGAFTYMWHSHTEKELTNNDIFPGGMLTMLFVEPSGVPIP